ncbi:MAG: hypothetical protein ABI587_16695 [Gemmatimonadales bacterium]
MLKPVLGVAAAGVIGFVLWKLMLLLLLPLFGIALAGVFVIIKVSFIIGMVCLAFWLVKRLLRDPATTV